MDIGSPRYTYYPVHINSVAYVNVSDSVRHFQRVVREVSLC